MQRRLLEPRRRACSHAQTRAPRHAHAGRVGAAATAHDAAAGTVAALGLLLLLLAARNGPAVRLGRAADAAGAAVAARRRGVCRAGQGAGVDGRGIGRFEEQGAGRVRGGAGGRDGAGDGGGVGAEGAEFAGEAVDLGGWAQGVSYGAGKFFWSLGDFWREEERSEGGMGAPTTASCSSSSS